MFLQCDIINLGFEKTEIAPKTDSMAVAEIWQKV